MIDLVDGLFEEKWDGDVGQLRADEQTESHDDAESDPKIVFRPNVAQHLLDDVPVTDLGKGKENCQ